MRSSKEAQVVRVLVLGGTRFLGPYVVDELLARDHEAAVLSRRRAEHGSPVRHFEGDASQASTLRQVLRSWRPECLLDMLHHGPEHAETVAHSCAGKVERTIHVSCAAVYGPNPVCPVDEDTDVARPDTPSPEVAAQIGADEVVLQAAANHEVPAVLIRLPELYGPRDPKCAEWFFVRRVLDGRTRIALPDSGLHICHRGFAQNMAWGIVQALTARRAPGHVYNLGEEKLYTLAQLARGVARALDHDWELYSVPGHLWTTPYAHTSFFDLRRARTQLRYRDRMIPRDGLELTVAWLCQNPRGDDWRWPGIERPFDYAREDALIDEHGGPISPD
jgi:nucleoside-diphosphate-sugar epimerase